MIGNVKEARTFRRASETRNRCERFFFSPGTPTVPILRVNIPPALTITLCPRVVITVRGKQDPDLASPENEAQLEYWSRVTQAYFLYFDSKRREWDERGEVYVRYGPP